MLSRRHLRIKVLQLIYAFCQSDNDNLDLGEKQLLKSIEKLYEQYIYILTFLTGIFEFAQKRIEEAKKKFLPTEDDLNPNTKFIDNKFIKQISDNKSLQKNIDRYKINWNDEEGMIRNIYQEIKNSKEYRLYIESDSDSYNEDKEIVIKILKKFISEYSRLELYFEDRNIYWASDYFIAIWMAIKTVKLFDESWDDDKPLPSALKSGESEDNEDKDFIILLFRKTILNRTEYEKMIKERAMNWELERIATMDKLILIIAIAELLEFSSIPVKVTLNEYIELAKLFSTHKSRIFINGILDKIISDLQRENKIVKKGRGLMS